MRFVVNRDLFAAALDLTRGIAVPGGPYPQRRLVLLDLNADWDLRVVATSRSISTSGVVKARGSVPGQITVAGHRLFDVIRSMPGEEIDLAVDENARITIRSKGRQITLVGGPAFDFPPVPKTECAEVARVDGPAVLDLLARTRRAMSRDELRPNLNGIYLRGLDGGRLRAVATDGHRLHVHERQIGEGLGTDKGRVIGRKGVRELRRLLKRSGDDVAWGTLGEHLVVRARRQTLTVQIEDVSFPDYRFVIPKASTHRFTVERQALTDLLSATVGLTDYKRRVRLDLDGSTLVVSGGAPDIGTFEQRLPVEREDTGPATVALNAHYVLDTLLPMKGPQVEVGLTEALAPVVIREPDCDFLAVVMPLRN